MMMTGKRRTQHASNQHSFPSTFFPLLSLMSVFLLVFVLRSSVMHCVLVLVRKNWN